MSTLGITEDKNLSKSKEHSVEIMNGLQENVACSATSGKGAPTLNDGFISDISSEPFIDSENGSLASCEGSTTGETISFKGNFGKYLKTAGTKEKKTSEQDKELDKVENESESQRDEEGSKEQSSSLEDVLEKDEQESEDVADGVEPLEDTDASQSTGNEQTQGTCNTTEVPTTDEEKKDLDNNKPAKDKQMGKKHSETAFGYIKKGDAKSKKKSRKRSSDDNPEESASAALGQKKRKKRQKKMKTGISLPVLEVGKLLEKCEISEERKKTEDKPAPLDKEIGTEKPGSDHDTADQEECADSGDRVEDETLPLDKEMETDKTSSDHDLTKGEEHQDSEDQQTDDLLPVSEKETETEKTSSDHDTVDQIKLADSEDFAEDLPEVLEKETEKEKPSSEPDITDQKETEGSEEQTEDSPILLEKGTDKENVCSDQDIADRKQCDDSEALASVLDKEAEKPKPSSNHDIAEGETSEDDMPLQSLRTRARKSKAKKKQPLSSVPSLTNGELDEGDCDAKNTCKKSEDVTPLLRNKRARKSTGRFKKKSVLKPIQPLPNGILEEGDYDAKNTCRTVTSCSVNLSRLTDEECREANIASVGCTILHPSVRRCYIRLQCLTQACRVLVQSKCFVRLNRLPSSMIPSFEKLAFESDVEIHLDVGRLIGTVDEEEEGDLDSGPVTRTVGAKNKRNTPPTPIRRAKRQKTRRSYR